MKEKLEKYYSMYNKKEYIHPDPLEFLSNYKKKEDIEIAGIIASSLAFGRVAQILKSVSYVLGKMEDSPYDYLKNSTHNSIKNNFKGFVYRFVREEELNALLFSIKSIFNDYDSIESCFSKGVKEQHDTILEGLNNFDKEIKRRTDLSTGYLFADPSKGSGCKRMNLFLRWMIRCDDVDFGIWKTIPPSKLIVPVDTHMHKIGLKFNFTKRKQANMKTALEITKGFRKFSPSDPVKYDFSLTRFGIRDNMSVEDL